jgi:hypothetical protein
MTCRPTLFSLDTEELRNEVLGERMSIQLWWHSESGSFNASEMRASAKSDVSQV